MISRKSILSVALKHFNTRTRSEFEMFMPVCIWLLYCVAFLSLSLSVLVCKHAFSTCGFALQICLYVHVCTYVHVYSKESFIW